ncbi:hypothetical protein TRFO_13827 [Tritrichomonas foetus]|uniref:Uncharacterized protein n=1 Tax=Tritrichomonas foetus TaxID=1144522 RepID=A0A1J4KY44_9EUKA|nr:hypothetical protein TRFO_13827 [Tritrichomonas foetus]|eukprot:OHT15808.1 hypothetical protein TRFO_13827 [Tritrichomonas foetus]
MEGLPENVDDAIEIEKSIAENIRLHELNQQLESQNDELKKQFETAIVSIQKMETINKENAQLKSQIFDLQAKNEELSQRLKISDITKSELSEKVQNALADSEREHQDEIQQLQAKILSLQNTHKIDTDRIKIKLQSLEETSLKATTENALLKSQVGKIMKLSENYFHSQFADVKQLMDHLMHPPPEIVEAISQTQNEQTQEKLKKLKQVKASFEKEKARCKQLELELIQIKQASQAESSKNSAKMAELEDSVRKLQNQNNSLTNEYKQEIVNIQKKYEASRKLHSMMTQTTEVDLGLNEAISEANMEIEKLSSKIRENENEMIQQKTQIDALSAQIEDSDAHKEKLRQKIQKLHAKNEQLVKELIDSQRKVDVLNEEIEQCNEEKENLESQIQLNKSYNFNIKDDYKNTIKELESTKNALDLLEVHSKEQAKELEHITNDRDHLLSLVHIQNQVLLETEEFIANAQKDPKVENHQTSSIEVPISGANWDFGSLPEELKAILKGFAENEGFPVDKRISQIFGVVSRWFANIEVENINSVKELNEKLQESNKAIHDFASSILNAIDNSDSLDMYEIVEEVSNIYEEKLTLQQKVNELQSIPQVCDQATLDEMNSTIETLQQIVKTLRNKNKQRKIELHECKEAFISVKNKSDEEIHTMQEANEKARTTIDQLQEQLDSLHSQNQELLDEINYTKENHAKDYSDAQSEIEAVLMEQSTKYDALKSELEKKIRERDNKIVSMQNKSKEFDSSLKKWEEISRQATDETRKVKAILNRTILEKDDQFSQMVHQKEKEIRQLESKYQEMIEDLKKKSEETEEIVTSMSKGIEENEAKMRQMSSQISQLNFQLQKADIQAQSKIDSVERQKKLAVAQLKAQLMAVETKYSVIADEQKHKWEAEKRNLFCYIAQQFGSFYDAKQALNEESFKQIVIRIKNEIEKHKKQEKTIRKLIKAKESQATEDALADLILSIHPQLQRKQPNY